MHFIVILALLLGIIATLMMMLGGADWSHQAWGAGVFLGCLGYLAFRALRAVRQVRELARLREAYEQLDRQAKLIIRTDLELHRTQEELDRKVAFLLSLHQLGRQLQVSLRPDEVYDKLDVAVVTNFGFSKGLLGVCPTMDALTWRSQVGVAASEAEQLRKHLVDSGLLKQILTKPAPQLLQLTAHVTPAHRRLLEMLGLPAVVIAGVLPHTGPTGCLVLGRTGSTGTSAADEELVGILANQLAIAVENSALYESRWTAQQELERNVQERTRQLADANAELVRLNRSKSEFVSSVSHELRTPLAAIKGYAALLGSGQFGALTDAQQERVKKVEKHADLLTLFVNNLLDIARIESGRVIMEHRAFPVEEFLTGVQDVIQPQLQAKKLRLAVDRDGVQELLGDPQHLHRVFVNLLSNAIKYTPDGGAIRMGFAKEGQTVVASVADTGAGIPAADLPKLFQEFYRANDAINQQVRGTGLGLALAKRIVEAHQGKIWVTSEHGKGSTFFVSLPAN